MVKPIIFVTVLFLIAILMKVYWAKQNSRTKLYGYAIFGVYSLFFTFAYWQGLSFQSLSANWAAVYVCYFLAWFVAISTFWLKPKWIGILSGSFLTLIFFVVVWFSLIILAFEGFASAALYTSTLENRDICHISIFGNATTAKGGVDIIIYKPVFFGMKKEYISKRIYDPDVDYSHKEEICKSVYPHQA